MGDAHVLIATPGRLQDLADRKLVKLDGVKIFVLDEADPMLDMFDFSHPSLLHPSVPDAPVDRLDAGKIAAVLTHEDEVRNWFSWPIARQMISELIAAGRLIHPVSGWLAAR